MHDDYILISWFAILFVVLFLLAGCQGPSGTIGATGPNGPPGTGCTVQDTESGALIICDDGTSVELVDGSDGLPQPHKKTWSCHHDSI